VPGLANAAGKHEGLNCTGCHGVHDAKGQLIAAVELNTKALNPSTNKPYSNVTAMCLSCHESPENGGMGILPVSAAMSHPYGVAPNPKVATVPAVFLRDGKLQCVGCHDPHPSNPNYKYLRVDTMGGREMSNFCAICHRSKADTGEIKVDVFNSMDERQAPAEMKAPEEKPAK
jgi:predicted CXXCH cytochrome family protein